MPRVIYEVGDDVSTDVIYPGRFMATVLPSETPNHAFADDAEFNAQLRGGAFPAGSIILAGRNFGCCSSREQAASTLRGHGLVVIARSFARIFLQNAVNLGLQTVTAPDLRAAPGEELELEPDAIVNRTRGMRFPIVPLPPARHALVEAGGLVAYTRKRLLEERT